MENASTRFKAILGLSIEKLPPLTVSLIAAELLFKFGSFTLECLSFLVLWRVLDWLQAKVSRYAIITWSY